MQTETLEVAKILGAYGVQGWVRVTPYAGRASGLQTIKKWALQSPQQAQLKPQSEWQWFEVMSAKWHNDLVLAQLQGVATKELADALKGQSVHIAKTALPKPASDEYYWVDLIGCTVFAADKTPLGVVKQLQDNGAQSVLEVHAVLPTPAAGDKPQVWLIPFVPAFIDAVDIQAKTIHTQWQVDY